MQSQEKHTGVLKMHAGSKLVQVLHYYKQLVDRPSALRGALSKVPASPVS